MGLQSVKILLEKIERLKEEKDELETICLKVFARGRRDALREVLDALYENEHDELCITQPRYKTWEDEINDGV